MTINPDGNEFADETPLQRLLGKKAVSPTFPPLLLRQYTPREINGWIILGDPGNGMTILRHKETVFTLVMSLN